MVLATGEVYNSKLQYFFGSIGHTGKGHVITASCVAQKRPVQQGPQINLLLTRPKNDGKLLS
jgi:hypothetical protein